MKRFKKFLAAALTGVLALTLLAGCSFEKFDREEYIKQVGDYTGVTYNDIGESQASALEDALHGLRKLDNFAEYTLIENVQIFLDVEEYEREEIQTLRTEFIKKIGITEDTNDYYFLSVCTLDNFSSAHCQNSIENAMAQQTISQGYRSAYFFQNTLSNRGTVSLKTITLEGKQYLLGVWMIAE